MDADTLRIGHGYDVHPFADPDPDPDPDTDTGADAGAPFVTSRKPLVLGGVRFDDDLSLVGHSDADVVAHACTDAVLGAAGHGDIGTMFPDDDERLLGADSVAMLRAAVVELVAHGWSVVNVDCTVVLDRPKIAPSRSDMERLLSDAVKAPVTVKGKRTEGLVGLSGGIQCFAVALVRRA